MHKQQYGTIGAMVLITTKTGKKNSKPRISFNSYTGFQETTKSLGLLNATEYALLLNESYANGGNSVLLMADLVRDKLAKEVFNKVFQ
jgi:hypothetical protein